MSDANRMGVSTRPSSFHEDWQEQEALAKQAGANATQQIGGFTFSSQADIVRDMVAEDLIRSYSDRESQRDEHELQRGERECSVGVRDLPAGMLMALNQIYRNEKVAVSVITKSLSHGVAVWFSDLLDVKHIGSMYGKVSDLCSDNGYDDLQADLDKENRYTFKVPAKVETMTGTTTLKSINWVISQLNEKAKPIGSTAGRIFCVGMCRLIALNGKGWADKTIDDLLEPEVNHFLWYLRERSLMLDYYYQTAMLRIERDSGKQNGKLFSRKLGNGSYVKNTI